jgi:endogenous inhibitor of DNA gyrase (YacG/DUF329 family)
MKKCPVCKLATDPVAHREWLPFCSDRCRLIDLGAWLNEHHRIPSDEDGPHPAKNEDDYTTH